MIQKIKLKIINKSEKSYPIKIFLLFLFFIKTPQKQKKHKNLSVLYIFIKHLLIYTAHCINLWFLLLINKFKEISFVSITLKKTLQTLPCLKKYFFIINLPVNLNEKESYIFRNKDFFFLKPCRIIEIQNSNIYLTSYLGLVFRNLKINKHSYHRSIDKRNSISKSYYKSTFESYTKKIFLQDEKVIKLNPEKKYIHVHHWFNYYHWLTETLYRIFSIKDDIKNYTLLLPEDLKNFSFVGASLNSIPDIDVEFFPEGSLIKYHKQYMVTHKPYCNNYNPKVLKSIKAHFSEYLKNQNISSPVKNERIYAIRSQNAGRSIANEDAFYKLLTQYNFELVDFEKYNFYEQLAISGQAKYLIGPHGAALTNIIWLPENAKVFELHKKEVNKYDHISIVYWRLAAILGHQYFYMINNFVQKDKIPENTMANYFQFDYINANYRINIDLDVFEKNLNLFLK